MALFAQGHLLESTFSPSAQRTAPSSPMNKGRFFCPRMLAVPCFFLQCMEAIGVRNLQLDAD